MGLGVSLISFSPNTVIKSADMNTNLSNLNGATALTGTLSGTFSGTISGTPVLTGEFTRNSGNTEVGQYFIEFPSYATGSFGSMWLSLLSRTATPISVSIDEAVQAHTNNANAASTAHLSAFGFEVLCNTSGINQDPKVGGNYTVTY